MLLRKMARNKYKKIQLPKGLFLYLNLDGQPLRLWPEKDVIEYNKSLNDARRVWDKRQKYLEKRKLMKL